MRFKKKVIEKFLKGKILLTVGNNKINIDIAQDFLNVISEISEAKMRVIVRPNTFYYFRHEWTESVNLGDLNFLDCSVSIRVLSIHKLIKKNG